MENINKCGCGGVALYGSDCHNNFIKCKECGISISERNSITNYSPTILEIWNTANPEISNAQQAVKWLEEGKILVSDKFNEGKGLIKDGEDLRIINLPSLTLSNYASLSILFTNTWKLYEEPLEVKVTKLPHEFEEGEEVLVRNLKYHLWNKSIFDNFSSNANGYSVGGKYKEFIPKCYCIPYLGNEHLENKVTDCKSGAVPDGYEFPKKYREVTYFEALKHFINNPESEVSHLVNCAADKEENQTLEMFLCIEPCGNYTLEAIKDDFCHGTSPHRPELIKSYKWRIYE